MKFRKTLISLLIIGSIATSVAYAEGESSPEPGTDDALIKAILMKEVIRIVEGNFEAAEKESGEVAKLIRALSGVSVKDIEKYGMCGGPNSEARKLFGDLCN